MTPEERSKYLFGLFLQGYSQVECERKIAAEIRSAIEHDRNKRTADDLYKHSFELGRKEGLKEATISPRLFMKDKWDGLHLL